MAADLSTALPASRAQRRPPTGAVQRLLHDRVGVGGLTLILVFALVVAVGPALAPAKPNVVNPADKLAPPSRAHLLGTDQLGRDELSRLLYGARPSLGAALLAASVMLLIGVTVGVVAGYYGGVLDHTVMRVVDVLLAFPTLVLALAIIGTLGAGLGHLLIGVIAIGWAGYARVVRGVTLSLRSQSFVEAARSVGASDRRLIVRHLLPNVISPVMVLWTLDLGRLLLTLAGLSFLGLGIPPPAAEWGSMLNQGRPYLARAPLLMVYPGMAISLAVLGFNLLGDGLRDALDPRLRRG